MVLLEEMPPKEVTKIPSSLLFAVMFWSVLDEPMMERPMKLL
mgnify:CR=1 FL=1